MYKENNEPSNLIYCLIKIKRNFQERKKQLINEEEESKNINYDEIFNESDREFVNRIYIFPKKLKSNEFEIEIIKNKKFKITFKYTNNFIFENNPGNNISDYYKFQIYNNFIQKYSSFSQLEKMLYDDCYNLCKNKSEIDFILLLEILCYYKDDKQKTEELLKDINSSSFSYINYNDLENNKDKYINYIQSIYPTNYKIEKNISQENMKILIQYYLDIFFSINNFEKNYEKYKKKDKTLKIIYSWINKNKEIEKLFIEKILKDKIKNTNKTDKIMKITSSCHYFENLIYILSIYIENPNMNSLNINDFSQRSYEISKEDNIDEIIKNYFEIKNKNTNIEIDKNIWVRYLEEFKKQKNFKNLLLLHKVIIDNSLLISDINECIDELFKENEFSNDEIYSFINENLNPNSDWLKGQIFFNLGRYINLNQDDLKEKMNELNMEKFFEDYNSFYAFQMTFVSESKNFKETSLLYKY